MEWVTYNIVLLILVEIVSSHILASYRLICWYVQLIMNKNDVFSTENKVAEVDELVKAAGRYGFMDATFSSLSMILVCEVSMVVNVTIQSLNSSSAAIFVQDFDSSGFFEC